MQYDSDAVAPTRHRRWAALSLLPRLPGRYTLARAWAAVHVSAPGQQGPGQVQWQALAQRPCCMSLEPSWYRLGADRIFRIGFDLDSEY